MPKNIDELWDDDSTDWMEMYDDEAHKAAKRDIQKENVSENEVENNRDELESLGIFIPDNDDENDKKASRANKRSQRFRLND